MVFVNYPSGFRKIPPKANGRYTKLSEVGKKNQDKYRHKEQDEGKNAIRRQSATKQNGRNVGTSIKRS